MLSVGLRALSGGRVFCFRPSLNIIRVVDSVIQVADKSSGEKNSIFWILEELGGWGKRKAVSRLNQASKQDLEGSGSVKVLSLEG